MKHLYRIICNWLFEITKSLINWCISTKRWKWASKIVSFRTKLAEASLYKLPNRAYTPANSNELLNIIAEKTDNPIIIYNMEITASNSMHRAAK